VIFLKKTTRLKQLINDKKVLMMPGAYDAFSAKLVEEAGFDAVQVSGFGLSASLLGQADVGLITMTEMVQQTRNIARSVDIPVMGDGDTGFGNAVNVYRTVQEFEEAGATGINLEDQVFPKRCGHMQGKEIISEEEMVLKIEAAADARRDKDFVINARTDAIAINGLDEAIKRGKAYAKAGADLIFIEAPTSIEEIKKAVDGIDAPVSINMLDWGKTPLQTLETLQEIGVARISFPLTTVLAAASGVLKALKYLKNHGNMIDYQKELMSFQQFTNIVGLPQVRELEGKYLSKETLERKYFNGG
jgi:carboxyvinyl-carboxyphosphonate phosphorylmutase